LVGCCKKAKLEAFTSSLFLSPVILEVAPPASEVANTEPLGFAVADAMVNCNCSLL